jgi:hypothetical protein
MADARQQLLDDGAHGAGAEKHCFLAAAAMEDAVGENMTALEIGGELNFIDRQKRDIDIGGHSFDRADPEARAGGNYLFLAGDEGCLMVADA